MEVQNDRAEIQMGLQGVLKLFVKSRAVWIGPLVS